MSYPRPLTLLIEQLKKLPGVGQKSAERYAFKMLDWSDSQLKTFGQTLSNLKENIHYCDRCGALSEKQRCFFCDNPARATDQLCIVASPKDIFVLEETHSFTGLYHVLGGLISPLHHRDSDSLNLKPLQKRIQAHNFKEIIIALDSTVEGDATTLLLKKEMQLSDTKVSRLAFGIPVGSSLDYIDGSTLSRALLGRRGF